jgi:alpha-mannosidase
MAGPTLTAAIPFGAIERPADGREMPAGEWLSLDEAGWGLSLLADSVFAYDARGAALNLTLLRSPIYAHHGHPLQRYQVDETLDWEYQEQGCRAGRWQLLAHRGDWRDAAVPARAAAFNNPVLMVTEANHPGARPRQDTLLAVAARSVLVTAVKQSEEGADIVIRLYEYAGREDEAVVTVRPIQRTFKVRLGPYEIKTVMLKKAAGWRPVETDLLEREEGEKGDSRLFSP